MFLATKIQLSWPLPSVFFISKQLVPITLQKCRPRNGAEVNVPYETCSLKEEGKGVSCKDHWIMMTNGPFPMNMFYPETLSDQLVLFQLPFLNKCVSEHRRHWTSSERICATLLESSQTCTKNRKKTPQSSPLQKWLPRGKNESFLFLCPLPAIKSSTTLVTFPCATDKKCL